MPDSDFKNQQIRFIHASDIHLGTGQYESPERADDFIKIMINILNLAISHKVDFILLGGDVFGSLDILPEQLSKIIRILNDFKQKSQNSIKIIAIEGNHDIRKYSRGVRIRNKQSWLRFLHELGLLILLDFNPELPPKKMFQTYDLKKKKGGKIRIKNALIFGTSYLGRKIDEYLPKIKKAIPNDDGLFHILIQHFGIKGQMKNVPGIPLYKVQTLKDRVDYLALGHYHLQFKLDGWIFNPGSGEAVSSVESNYKRGVFLVNIKPNLNNKNKNKNSKFSIEVKNIVLKNREHIWHTIYLSQQFQQPQELYSFICENLRNKFSMILKNRSSFLAIKPLLYLTLRGYKPSPSENLNIKELKNKIFVELPVVGVRIYEKYIEKNRTLETFISEKIYAKS